jgi:hypothetical protein
MTCRQSAGALSLTKAGMGSIAHVLHLDDSVFAEARHHFQNDSSELLCPTPGQYCRPDIAPPAEKSIQETDRLIQVRDHLPVLYRVKTDVSTVPDREPPIRFRNSLVIRKFTYSSTRGSHPVFPGCRRCTASVEAGRHPSSRLRLVFWRQLALIVDGIVIWISAVNRAITVEPQVTVGFTTRSVVRKDLADGGAGILPLTRFFIYSVLLLFMLA